MNVLHVTSVPQTLVRLFPGLVAHQRANGWDVHAATSPSGGWVTAADAADRLGIPVHPVELRREVSPAADMRAFARLTALLRSLRPRVVHAHTPKAGLVALAAARLTGCPVRVYTVRGAPHVTATGALRRVLAASERLSARNAHRLVAVSPSVAEELERIGVPRDKVTVLGDGSGQGVDAGRFDPERVDGAGVRERLGIPEGAPVVGFVGRLARDKGVHELALAWEGLSTRRPDAHLILAGPADEPRAGLRADLVERLLGHPRVHHSGNVEDIERYYAAMDVLAFPSHREGFPNVVLEAAAMRVPVVAFDVVGSRDAVEDGRTGLLVAPPDLGKALESLLDDPGRRARMGEQARDRVLRRFRPEDVFRAVDALYAELGA